MGGPVHQNTGNTHIHSNSLASFSSNAVSLLYVLWHNIDAFGMNGAQVIVFKMPN